VSLLQELKRRNVFRVGIAYLVASWLLLQITDILVPILDLPDSAARLVFLLLVIGLIPALIFAWAFELTPEGIKRERDVDRNQSVTSQTGRKLDRVIIGILVAAVIVLLVDRVTQKPEAEPSTADRSAEKGSEPFSQVSTTSPEIPSEEMGSDPLESTIKSIAVLPFVNMSSDPEQEYFSDGLAEELLNRLTKNPNLRVAARTSAFQFKGQNLDVADIGRQLKVDHVLEGSVRKSGSRLRITAQLIKTEDGFHLWSETYERELTDVFAIQDEISGAINTALELQLDASVPAAATPPTSNLEAYNLYLRGRYLLATRGGDNMLQADVLFDRAVARDPDFSAAWSAMAFNSSLLFGYTYQLSAEAAFAKALRAAKRAIELDPENAEAYIALGRTQIWYFHNWQEGEAAANRAYELAPNNAEVVNLYGDVLFMLGDFESGERIERKAALLDPLSATNAFDVAIALLIQNRPEEALEPARTAMDLAPDSYYRVDALVYALLLTGRTEEARALIETTVAKFDVDQQDPVSANLWWSMYFYETDDREGLRAYWNEMGAGQSAATGPNAAAEVNALPASYMAFFTLWLDGAEAALPWLQIAHANGEFMLLRWVDYFYLPERMSTDSKWLEFWNQPEYQGLLEIRRSRPYDNISYWKKRPSP
jgi:TolB-like protein/Tfp pilus assembly protein PilF